MLQQQFNRRKLNPYPYIDKLLNKRTQKQKIRPNEPIRNENDKRNDTTMSSVAFDFDLVETFSFDENNNMIFNLDPSSLNTLSDKSAEIDAVSDDASESTIDGTTSESLSEEDGADATAFDFTSPTLNGLDEYSAYNWSDFTYTPLDQSANEFYFDSNTKAGYGQNGSSLKSLKTFSKSNRTKTNKKRAIDFKSPTVLSSPVRKKQRALKVPSKLETERLMHEVSKSLKAAPLNKAKITNKTGTKTAANAKKSNAGNSPLSSKNQKTKKEKATKSKAASKKSSKRKKGRNASGSYSIKQKFNDGIPRIGVYTIPERKALLARFHAKRKKRVFSKKIKYECRKVLANDRPRVRGRFVKVTDLPRYHECLAKGIPFVPTPATK